MDGYITPVDVARAAGITARTARKYIEEEEGKVWERTRRRFPKGRLSELVELCKSKQKRKCSNVFNRHQRQRQVN
jgi:predicted transcriptional regulator